MFESCMAKQADIKSIFEKLPSQEERYERIIQFGKELPRLDPSYKTKERLVSGCQSETYLMAQLKDNQVHFEIASDALISAGLAALLVYVYNGESPETVLKCPPKFLEELGLSANLTPSRANGLYSIHLRMKQEALKLLLK